jgi:hypothetical protein
MRFLVLTTVIVSLAFSSCKKLDLDSIKNASWNPKFATPLAYGTFTVKDMLAKFDSSGVIKNNNGDLSIVVTSSFPVLEASKFIQLPTVSETFDLTPPEIATYGATNAQLPLGVDLQTQNANTQIIDFPINSGQEIASIDFTKGDLEITLATTLKQDINVKLSFPDFQVNGVALEDSIKLIYSNTTPMSKKITFPLANVKADFTNEGTSSNKIRINASGRVSGTGEAVAGSEYLKLTCAMSKCEFGLVKGYFGQISVANPPDSILLDQFESFKISKGEITLTNPSIKMNFSNTFGFPVQLGFDTLAYQNKAGGPIVKMTHTPASMPINYPKFSEKGIPAKTTVPINTSNTTNLDQLISSVSKYLIVQPSAKTNKDGKTTELNYILGSSQLTVDTEIDVPLEGYATGFERQDTIDVDGTFDVDNSIQSVIIRLVLNNGFPLEIDGSMCFIDAFGNKLKNNGVDIDLLKLNPTILASGKVDANGSVTATTTTTNDIIISSEILPLLKTAKKLIFKTSLGTTNGTANKSVKLRDDYTIGFKLGVNIQAGLKIKQ